MGQWAPQIACREVMPQHARQRDAEIRSSKMKKIRAARAGSPATTDGAVDARDDSRACGGRFNRGGDTLPAAFLSPALRSSATDFSSHQSRTVRHVNPDVATCHRFPSVIL